MPSSQREGAIYKELLRTRDLALYFPRMPSHQRPLLTTPGKCVSLRPVPWQPCAAGRTEALAKITQGGRPSPQLPCSRRACTAGPPVCLHLIYSCVQSYLGTRSAPRAGLCVFITTQLCVDSPPYRSHLHHFTHPPGARGLLPDLTSGAGRSN